MKKVYLILGILLIVAIAGCSTQESEQPLSETNKALTQTEGDEDLFIKLQADLICVGGPLDLADKEVLSEEEHRELFSLLPKYGLSDVSEYERLLERYGDNEEAVKAVFNRASQICPEVYRELMGL